MDIETVRTDIERWITEFVEVPHPALGDWPPCPYARRARLDGEYQVRLGIDPYYDLVNISRWGLNDKKVIIMVYDPKQWTYAQFNHSVESANRAFLLPKDLIALEDHPDDPEIVNGISMNQGSYALALIQSLSDLTAKARAMARQGFYDAWPEDYLGRLFHHREDPRS